MRNRKIIAVLSIIFLVIIGEFGLSKPAGNEGSVIDFTAINFFGNGWTYAYKTSEYALSKNASFIRGAFQIEMALREL